MENSLKTDVENAKKEMEKAEKRLKNTAAIRSILKPLIKQRKHK